MQERSKKLKHVSDEKCEGMKRRMREGMTTNEERAKERKDSNIFYFGPSLRLEFSILTNVKKFLFANVGHDTLMQAYVHLWKMR